MTHKIFHLLRGGVMVLLIMLTTLFAAPHAWAGAPQIIIRDAEIENNIATWSKGVVNAAGMNPEQVKIILVQSSDVNAFVAGGANIFINTGLIEKTQNEGELIAVIAHELGHIAGGHLTRTGDVARNASFETMIGALLGIGAAVATKDSSAAAAGIRIGQGQALNKYMAFSRVQESSADQAGFRFMTGAGYNPTGLVSFLQKLSSQELLTRDQQSLYVRTHPLSSERIEALKNKVDQSGLADKPWPSAWNEDYLRSKAKLLAFTSPQQIPYKYGAQDHSIAADYARAIAAYRTNHVAESLAMIDALIAREPKNPYFLELKGQMLFDYGRAVEAVGPYQKASELAPNSGLIRLSYAQALIESAGKNPAPLQEAIKQLKRGQQDEPRVSRIKRLLATAYGRLGQEPQARVYLAEEALMQGNKKEALNLAKSAKPQLPPKSPEAIRAQDIIDSASVGKP